jgi:hypothetical protein
MLYHVQVRVDFTVLGHELFRQIDLVVNTPTRPTVRQIKSQIQAAVADLVERAGYEGPKHSYEETSYEYVVQSIFRSP